ncbi:hypothetical protein [Falsirhodobacter deserti]|uniref:hypothetical protein n=1 Tax=Falsirhodobacter deserti TaxID=1365611 RepID=UPI000FE3B7C0|nr:hypothetical protein [Falsirhodobacter deserti]
MKTPILAALLAAAALPAIAQPRPVPLRGEVESFAPGTLNVTARTGETVALEVPDTLEIVSMIPRAPADIAVGDAVSTTAVPDGNGGLTALQVSILPAAMAGQNEGQRPWDAAPDSVMTNATISGVATVNDDGQITLKYGDETVTMTVPAHVPVISFGPGDADLLAPGADVFIIAMQAEDGTLSTNRVIAESNGIKPPM